MCVLNARRREQDLKQKISHDNYRKVTGGTQICIQIEADRADQAGMDYLNIHPVRTCNALLSNAETEAAVFRLVLNGESIGVARYSELIAATSDRISAGQTFQCVIHHLLGHSPEAVAQLLEASCDGKASATHARDTDAAPQ